MTMYRQILLTGATGALGPALAAELVRARAAQRIAVLIRCQNQELPERFHHWLAAVRPLLAPHEAVNMDCLCPLAGDICLENLGLAGNPDPRMFQRETDVVIHAAADTNFAAPPDRQNAVNVGGTQRMLDWSADCPHLQRFLLISSVFVSGSRTGIIAETATREPPDFVTHYQRTKWEAEQLTLSSGLPVGVARISLVVGSHATGSIHRTGAVHNLIKWFARGLVPMVPGLPEARGDIIATETAALCLTRAVLAPEHHGGWGGTLPPIWHIAAAEQAPRMTELIDFVYRHFAARPVWRSRRIPVPRLVPQLEFERFIASIQATGRTLVAEALRSVNRFLPDLNFPKVYQTPRAQALWGGPLPQYDWRQTMERVIRFCCPVDQ
ncbi:MAG TPA: SDR family oxidoreductase [Phycisphaerae bacterium]